MRSYGHDEHMILYNPGPGKRKIGWEEANALSAVHATRCAEGYGLDCSANIKSQYHNNAWLQDMWKWMDGESKASQNCCISDNFKDMSVAAEKGGMVVGRLDLSFIGIYSVWNNYLGRYDHQIRAFSLILLGPNISSRLLEHSSQKPSMDEIDSAITTLIARKNIAPFTGTATSYPEHRALCEAINLSSLSVADLSHLLESFQTTWQHTKAAAWALFHSAPSLAISALQTGPQHLQALAIAIAASPSLSSPPQAPTQPFQDVCTAAASKSSDPYTHALLAYLSTGSWESFLASPNLPTRDRIACALRVLPDPSLTSFLSDLHARAISIGDITALPLIGLSPPALPLFETYIRQTNDFPTAVLALTHRPPTADVRFQAWRAHFIQTLHQSRLFHTLASYNQNATHLSPKSQAAQTPQLSLRCNTCSKPLTYASSSSTPDSSSTQAAPLAAATTIAPPLKSTPYTHCRTCNALLPRCSICRLHLGMPSTDTVAKAAEAGREDVRAKRMVFCAECKHGYHFKCAGEWFGSFASSSIAGESESVKEEEGVEKGLRENGATDRAEVGNGNGNGSGKIKLNQIVREECPVPDCTCLCGA